MRLYHFTSPLHAEAIEADGFITKGDVAMYGPYAPGINAVWLSSDPNPEGNGIELDHMDQFHPQFKKAVRFDFVIPKDHSQLRNWHRWSRSRVDPTWLRALNATGNANNWWLFFQPLPLRAPFYQGKQPTVHYDDVQRWITKHMASLKRIPSHQMGNA